MIFSSTFQVSTNQPSSTEEDHPKLNFRKFLMKLRKFQSWMKSAGAGSALPFSRSGAQRSFLAVATSQLGFSRTLGTGQNALDSRSNQIAPWASLPSTSHPLQPTKSLLPSNLTKWMRMVQVPVTPHLHGWSPNFFSTAWEAFMVWLQALRLLSHHSLSTDSLFIL